MLTPDFDVLIPGAHGHPMVQGLDGPSFAPVNQADFEEKLAALENAKRAAIERDNLEAALRIKKTISVLRRAPRLDGQSP